MKCSALQQNRIVYSNLNFNGRVFDSDLLRKYWPRMDRVLTPQQQCLLLFFLNLPVDQATSKNPPLRERCLYTLDTGLFQKQRPRVRDLITELDTGLHLKTKRSIRDLTTELESRSNMEPLEVLG